MTEVDFEDLEGFDAGVADLEDRASLRRVAGIRTELADITEVEYRALRLERVVLVGIGNPALSDDEIQRSFSELKLLAETAGSEVMAGMVQSRRTADPATYLGSGKVIELAELVSETEADTVICDGELSPAQLRNLEDRIGAKVIDRTALILDIFAQHAKSKEGKTQIELAQLLYMRQRLRGWGTSLSRQVGGRAAFGVGIGGRGPGETKIETDRRRIGTRLGQLQAQLKKMEATRKVERAERVRNQIPSVAIVGYTNAGKSSLLNALTEAKVLVDNSLFATLDPTTRRAETPNGRAFTLTDTVGFIRRLPTNLVAAFASTLEETVQADLLLHIVDASDPDPAGQIEAVREVLIQIKASEVPEQLVINKIDLVDESVLAGLRSRFPDAVPISILTGTGIEQLLSQVEVRLPEFDVRVEVLLPYERGDLLDRVHRQGRVEAVEHTPVGTKITARVDRAVLGVVKDYLVI